MTRSTHPPSPYPQFQTITARDLGIDSSNIVPPIDKLYVRGALPERVLLAPRISIVGSREAAAPALRWAQAIAYHCSRRGIVIVSGGARGIDLAAHCGALQHGGPTWWVAGTSIDRIYPAEHRWLLREVISGGGTIFSEIEPKGKSGKHMFRMRNRIIAALGDALVVVAAGARSGTLSTVEYARAMGKPIFLPSTDEVPETRGVAMLREVPGIRSYHRENVVTELSKRRARCIGPQSLRGIMSSTTSAR